MALRDLLTALEEEGAAEHEKAQQDRRRQAAQILAEARERAAKTQSGRRGSGRGRGPAGGAEPLIAARSGPAGRFGPRGTTRWRRSSTQVRAAAADTARAPGRRRQPQPPAWRKHSPRCRRPRRVHVHPADAATLRPETAVEVVADLGHRRRHRRGRRRSLHRQHVPHPAREHLAGDPRRTEPLLGSGLMTHRPDFIAGNTRLQGAAARAARTGRLRPARRRLPRGGRRTARRVDLPSLPEPRPGGRPPNSSKRSGAGCGTCCAESVDCTAASPAPRSECYWPGTICTTRLRCCGEHGPDSLPPSGWRR